MREIVLDTETTGLDPAAGHKVIEIGCVELLNRVPTGEVFHCYINPERDIPPDSEAIHGITDAMVADKPVFAEIAEDMLSFIAEDPLVIHNASFDLGFLNAELAAVGQRHIPSSRGIDTVRIARKKFPGSPANLDALCKRFNIDNSKRTKHGALLDAELLAEVYVELSGGRQHGLSLVDQDAPKDVTSNAASGSSRREIRPPRPHAPAPAEIDAHAALLAKLKDPIWSR